MGRREDNCYIREMWDGGGAGGGVNMKKTGTLWIIRSFKFNENVNKNIFGKVDTLLPQFYKMAKT